MEKAEILPNRLMSQMNSAAEEHILHEAHDAVAPRPDITPGAGPPEGSRRRFNKFVSRAAALGSAAVIAFSAAEAVSPDRAEADQSGNVEITTIETSVFGQVAKSHSRDFEIDTASVQFLEYVRANGLPRRFVNRRNCYWDRDGFYNSGARINSPNRPRRIRDVGWFHDTRPAYICHVPRNLSPTGLAKANCGNFVMNTPPPAPLIKRPVIMVRNALKAKINVSANSKAEARAECRSADGLAMAWAYGRGNGHASARLSLRKFLRLRTRGRLRTRLAGEAEAEAKSFAAADAEAECFSRPAPFVPPGEKVDFPPSVDLEDLQHVKTNGEVQLTARESDPDNNIVARRFEESGDGNFISSIRPGNEPGEFHIDFRGSSEAGTAVITYTAIDANGNSDSDTETIPIDDSERGEF